MSETRSAVAPFDSREQTSPPSPIRGWLFLIWFSFRRIARSRQMIGISLGLLAVCMLLVGTFSVATGWNGLQRRIDRSKPYNVEHLAGGMAHAAVDQSEYMDRVRTETRPLAMYSRWVVFILFLGFLMPIFTLSFATGAIGQDRESRSLVWLTTRPLPRSAIYLAKFLGVLPWCLLFTVGGFAILCALAGDAGKQALPMYLPAIAAGTVAFAAIFHMCGAITPRPAIVGLLYAFFFETMLSELPIPGTVKRLSVNYYTRCLLYDAADRENVPTESSSLFVPVSTEMAWAVLLLGAVGITAIGMWLFAYLEPRDDA